MAKIISLVPQGGISRLPMTEDAAPGTPFDLHNCRVLTDVIRPVRSGVEGMDLVTQNEGLPYFRHNDRYVTGCLGAGVKSGAWHNNILYTTGCGCGGPECTMGFDVYPASYPDVSRSILPPRISAILDPEGRAAGPNAKRGIGGGYWVSYLLIPKNDRGEAGEWAYTWYYHPDPDTAAEPMIPRIRVQASNDTSYIEVYRTSEHLQADSRTGSIGDTDTCLPKQYYKIGELSESSCYEEELDCDPAERPIDDSDWTNAGTIQGGDTPHPPPPAPGSIRLGLAAVDASGPRRIDNDTDTSLYPWDAIEISDNAGSVPVQVGDTFTVTGSGWGLFDDGAFGVTLRNYVDIANPLGIDKDEFKGGRLFGCQRGDADPDISMWTLEDTNVIREYMREVDGPNGVQMEEAAPGVPASAVGLDRLPNVHNYTEWLIKGPADKASKRLHSAYPQPRGPVGDPVYGGFCANTMLNDSGTMIYGGVSWATKQPKISYARPSESVNIDDPIRNATIVYEYDVGGEPVYGPPIEIPFVGELQVERGGGEVAVLVFVGDEGVATNDRKLWERVPIGDLGVYSGSCDSCFTFDIAGWNADKESRNDAGEVITYGHADIQGATKLCIKEENVAFLSESLRPWEAGFDQFTVDRDEKILHLAHARLDERESQAKYSFYVATDKGIYYANRNGKAVTLDRIDPLIGVATGSDGQALWVETHFGGAYVGTDGHLWYITGRDQRRLSMRIQETPGKGDFYADLWDKVFSIAYHTRFREVWLATDKGVWAFDMGDLNPANRQGVIAQYDLDADRIWFDKEDDTLLLNTSSVGNMFASGANLPVTALVNEGPYMPDPSVTFNRFGNGTSRLVPDWFSVDYDPMPASRLPGDQAAGTEYASVTLDARTRVMKDTAQNALPSPNAIPRVEPGSRRYPRIAGTGIRVTVSEFEELRQVDLQVSGVTRNS